MRSKSLTDLFCTFFKRKYVIWKNRDGDRGPNQKKKCKQKKGIEYLVSIVTGWRSCCRAEAPVQKPTYGFSALTCKERNRKKHCGSHTKCPTNCLFWTLNNVVVAVVALWTDGTSISPKQGEVSMSRRPARDWALLTLSRTAAYPALCRHWPNRTPQPLNSQLPTPITSSPPDVHCVALETVIAAFAILLHNQPSSTTVCHYVHSFWIVVFIANDGLY